MTPRKSPKEEKGYALAVVVVFTTVLLVSLSAAVINWQKAVQREREEELIFRGKQFIRAIELWQRKYPGTFPTSIDALLNTNNMRFLRKKWKDPITNSEEWRLIKLNPDGSISGLTVIPTGGLPGAKIPGAPGQTRTPSLGTSPPGTASGQTAVGTPETSSTIGSPLGSSSIGSPNNPQNPPGGRTGQLRRSSLQSSASPVLGGIVGVASTSEKESLKVYNGRSKYNEWEFYYVPRQQSPAPAVPGQQPLGQRPSLGQPGAGFGTQPPAPSSPQQGPAQTPPENPSQF
jgi:type II secretory pathway pseudopilin PulG